MLALVACSANFITRLSLCWGVPRDFSHLKQMLFKFFFPRSLHVSLLFPIPWWVSKLFKKFLLSSGVLHERGSADQLIAPSLPPSSQKYCCGFFLPWWGKSELARPEEAHLGRALPGARLLHSAALGPGPAPARRTSTPPPPRRGSEVRRDCGSPSRPAPGDRWPRSPAGFLRVCSQTRTQKRQTSAEVSGEAPRRCRLDFSEAGVGGWRLLEDGERRPRRVLPQGGARSPRGRQLWRQAWG